MFGADKTFAVFYVRLKTHPPAPSLEKRRGAESDIYLL